MRGRNVPTARPPVLALVWVALDLRVLGDAAERDSCSRAGGFRQMMFTETELPGVCIMEPQDSMVGAHRSERLMTCG